MQPAWRIIVILFLLPVLCASTAFAQADANAAKVEALQKQLESLQSQMADLQEQLKTLSNIHPPAVTAEHAQTLREPEAELSGARREEVEKATSQYQTFSQDQFAAARVDNAPLDPKYPGYFRIPGTNSFMKIGGYFKTDFIFDTKPAGDAERFIPSTFPVPTPSGVNDSTVSVRPTRLNLDFLVPTKSLGDIRVFIEGDLFGSNATTPRLRHAYTQVRNLLIGQTFSGFQDPDAGPDQLEFQGPNGQVSLRNPQLRYTAKLAKKTTLSFSVEKASSDVAFKTPEFNALPNDPMPDFTVKLRHGMDRGHIQVAAIFRDVAAYLPSGVSDSVFGWGISISGSIKTIGKDTFVYQGAYGQGIERYLNDTSGLGIDAAVISNTQPELKALPVVGTYAAYQHWWFSKLRSSAIYGFVQVDNTIAQSGSTFHQSNYAEANVIWNPFGSLNVGVAYLYGWINKMDKSTGNASRIMFSAKYNFDFVKKAAY